MTAAKARFGHHVVQEFGFAIHRKGDEGLRGTAEIVPELCVPGTSVLRASVIATWADMLTGLLAVDVVGPRVPVTLQLDVDLFAPPADIERIVGVARRLKVGSSVLVAAVDFAAEDGRLVGRSIGTFMVSPDPGIRMPGVGSPVEQMGEPGGPLPEPLADRVGCVRRPPNQATLELRDGSLNTSGTLNGGLLAVVAEEAVLGAVPGATLASLALRYLRPVRTGPAVATAEMHGSLAEVTVRDEGREDLVAVAATARVFR